MLAFEDFVSYFKFLQTELFVNFAANFSFQVVEGWQAVFEDNVRVFSSLKNVHGDLVW